MYRYRFPKIETAAVQVYHSAGDDDYNIVSTAGTMAERRSVAVVGAAAPSQSHTSCQLPTD